MPVRAIRGVALTAALLLVGCGGDADRSGELRFVGLSGGTCASGAAALFGKVPVRLALASAEPNDAGSGGLRRVALVVGGGTPLEDSSPPFQVEVDTALLPDGDVTFEAAGELSGGGEVKASLQVCVDNGGPKLTLISPGSGSGAIKVEDAELVVRARATDPAGVLGVEATLAGGGAFHHAACTPPGGPDVTCQLRPTDLALALQPKQTTELTLRVVARDKLGRESSLERTLTLGTRLLWSVSAGAPIQWAPVVSPAGVIMVGTDAGSVLVIDPQTHTPICTYTALPVSGKADSVAAPMTLSADGSRLYLATLNRVIAVDTASCAELWSGTGLHAASRPALDEAAGVVYIGSYGTQAASGSLVAYGTANGTVLGTHPIAPIDGAVTSSPALSSDGKRVYIGSSDFKLYAVDASSPANMKTLWTYATAGKVESGPLVTSTRVYVAGSGKDRAVHAVDPQSGQIDSGFNFSAQAGFYSGPRPGPGGVLYIGSLDANLYAVDATTGKTLATYATGRMLRAEPAFGPGNVVFAVSVEPARLYALSDKLKLLWSATPSGGANERISASPTVHGDTVLIATSNGYLHALDATAPGS